MRKFFFLCTRKWCIVTLLCLLIPFAAYSQQQLVTMEIKELALKKAVEQIGKQVKMNVAFSKEFVDPNIKVSLKVNGVPVEKALDQLFKGTSIGYRIVESSILLFDKNTQIEKTPQEKSKTKVVVRGRVVDQSTKEPIIGATVMIPGTTTGVITDIDGNYSIVVESGESLLFTCIGYADVKQMAPKDGSLDVVMREHIVQLNDMVVVGYGVQKKVNLTGAVAMVDATTFESRPVSNVSQMLQGAIPNLNVSFGSGRPGESGAFNIRGATSINGGSPLVLIDGIEGSIDRINPNDVESISVLKDASASAVYGARASYGVILVTTKKGQKGKSQVRYNGKFAFSRSTTSTDFETRGYYSAMINDTFYKAYAGKNYTNYTESDYEQLWLRRNDRVEHPERPWVVIDQRDGRDTYVYYANTDWYNYLYDNSRPTWEHNLSFSGGNEKVQYLISGGTFDQDGIIKVGANDQYTNYNFRSKIDAQVFDWLDITSNTRFFKSEYEFPGYNSIADHFDYTVLNALACFVPVNPDGTATYFNSLSAGRITEGRHTMLVNDKHRNVDQKNDFSTSFEAVIKISKDFNIKSNYSHSVYNGSSMNRSAPLEYSKYPGEILTRTDDIGLDQLSETVASQIYNAVNVYGNYQKQFLGHNISAVAGYNYETRFAKSLNVQREGLLTTELNDFNLAKGQVMNIVGGRNRYKIMGGFYRLNYDFKGKYLFETSGRYDGSSRFPSGHRFGFFPSASIGWRISEESFFSSLRMLVDNFKIRASYGELGNQQLAGYYDYLQAINTSGEMAYSFGDGSKAPYASVSSPNAANMTWEQVSTQNLGVDIAIFNSRFSFSGDIYSRDTKGMISAGKLLPGVYGAPEPKMNAADLRTKGWEISLQWHDDFLLRGSKFGYNIGIGLSDNTTHITKFDNPTKNLSSYYKGQRLGDIWGYSVDGFFQSDEEASSYSVDQSSVNNTINASAGSEKGLRAGDLKFLDLDGDNVISIGANTADNPGDRKIIGNSQARYNYGVNAGFDWMNFDFSLFLQGVGRKHWYPATQSLAFWGPYSRPFATFIPSDFLSDVWSPENPNSYFPRPRGYVANATNRELGAVNDRYLQNLAYCRLKNITLGYALPEGWLAKVKISKLRVYFSGENLLTLTKLRSKYIDPEQAASGKGGYGKVYPWAKTYSFGLDLTF